MQHRRSAPQLPAISNALVGEGARDTHYRHAKEELVWHHHFTREELLGLAGPSWRLETCQFGGLLLFPISDILRWPFYRLKRTGNWIVSALEKMATAVVGVTIVQNASGTLLLV